MKALPEGLELSGLGGPGMREVSGAVEDWLEDAAVLGLVEVLRKYRWFRLKMDETAARIHVEQPDAVVLIDYPGFNLRLAKRLRNERYEGKLIFYISPQVWAWKKGRIKVMAELLDLMICIFPFEKALYESSGLPTVFAGHPLVELRVEKAGNDLKRDPKLVALLPGSREREIEALFPVMLDAANRMRKKDPELRFAASAASERLAARMKDLAEGAGCGDVEVGVKNVHDVMRRAVAGVVASGTATLEAAILGLPYCLVYKVAWGTYVVGRMVVNVDYLGIVNVIAGREVVKELLQGDATGEKIAAELERLTGDPEARERLTKELDEVVGKLGRGDANRNAAAAVMEAIEQA